MKKANLTFVVLLFLISSMLLPEAIAQRVNPYLQLVSQKADENAIINSDYKITGEYPSFPIEYYTRGSNGQIVPFRNNYHDYATNGNSLSMIYVIGDTIFIAVNYVDSLEANNANGGTTSRVLYNFSTDAGMTWQSTDGYEMTSADKSRWADLYSISQGGLTTVVTGGRLFQGSIRKGGVSIEAFLGLGSGTPYFIDGTGLSGNSDAFIHKFDNDNLAVLYSPNSTDSMNFIHFNSSSLTFGSPVNLFNNSSLSNTVSSYSIGASQTGGHATVAYVFINEPANGGDNWRSVRVQTTTDYGATWSAIKKYAYTNGENNVIDGDSCQPYWHEDIAYKPGTQTPYVVYSTYPYVWDGSATTIAQEENKGWKVVIQSPDLNNEQPVVVADWRNIEVLGNVSLYNQLTNPFQVNSTFTSHPSVGFSNDGSVIYVAFSVIQTDTCTVGINNRYYHFYDVYLAASTDGGTTWAVDNVTNTADLDEMYPVVAEFGNTNDHCHLTYHSTAVSGSQNFGPSGENPQSPTAVVHQIYNKVQRPVSVNNISSEIPEKFDLKQNFPNPFNPETKIRFDITKTSNVSLKVYDSMGREIATLINNQTAPVGTNEVTFNASNLSSGVYFYTLSSGDFKMTKKMLLMK